MTGEHVVVQIHEQRVDEPGTEAQCLEALGGLRGRARGRSGSARRTAGRSAGSPRGTAAWAALK